MAKEQSKDRCNCMPGVGLVALVLSVIGIYFLILGVKFQWASELIFNNWTAMACYLVGILAMAMAKLCKHNAFCKCDMHRID